jgi:membrane fusion protein (multidrug efflux system)
MNDKDSSVTANQARRRRLRMLGVSLSAFGGIGIAYGAYWAGVLRYYEATDDAYVNGNVVQITPQISGTVVAVNADDTQFVKAGQTLVQLDQADAKVALDEAEAQLARTVREVRNLFATTSGLEAVVGVRMADLAQAQQDYERRERLGDSGAVSGEELQHAREALKAARSALVSAQQQMAANRARIDGTTLEDHPDVRAAAAAVHNAYLTYARTTLPAPVAGFVAKRNVQLGERVGPGTPLMAVVPLEQVWVDANFKEPQLAGMRVGQPVTLTADLYGHDVTYHGRVEGFGAGTGAAFSLLPAQNATGNWIKIIQRVPVRIALDPKDLAAHPLQIGLSMKADVDIHHSGGERLPQLASHTVTYSTDVFSTSDQAAEQRVAAVILANRANEALEAPVLGSKAPAHAQIHSSGADALAPLVAGGSGGGRR